MQAEILRRLYFDCRGSSRLLVPRYTPAGWWECDLFRVTKAGYVWEYEIKCSISDFKRDTEKQFTNWKHNGTDFEQTIHNKHQYLAQSHENAPNRFFYVVPGALVDKVRDLVPPYAGLLRYDRFIREVIPAPKIHNGKVKDHVELHAKGVCVWRYWDLLLRQPTAVQVAS